MTAWSLFMSWGPVRKTANAAFETFIVLGVFLKLKSEGCLQSKCSVCLNHMGMFKWLVV